LLQGSVRPSSQPEHPPLSQPLDTLSVSAAAYRPVTATAFRRWILRPAEGVFLFHLRAIERMQEQGRDKTGSTANLCYHLMEHRVFLERLESENPEALSVIEGLPLPEWILLLPMPAAPTLRSTAGRTLLRDYWGRRFEGETARAWQTTRDANQDLADFGPAALTALIGASAVREARDILLRSGVPGAAEGEAALCRAFVARVVRLRYFAPGARGCYFPAVADWGAVDGWLEDGGLDLPAPLVSSRLPLALERARPAMICGAPPVLLPFPPDLPFGRSDPDRSAVARRAGQIRAHAAQAPATPRPGLPTQAKIATTIVPAPEAPPAIAAEAGAPTEMQARCLAALQRGMHIRRSQGLPARLWERLHLAVLPLVALVLEAPVWLPQAAGAATDTLAARWATRIRLRQLQHASAAAQRAEWEGRFAAALRRLAGARRVCRRLRTERTQGDPVDRALDRRQEALALAFADLLAVPWRLPPAAAVDLGELIQRLAAAKGRVAKRASALLGHLEKLLQERDTLYYRVNVRNWLGTGRLRQILPFQGNLKGLAALRAARRLLDELPWPVEDADRFAVPIDAMAREVRRRLEETLKPRIKEAVDAADLVAVSVPGPCAGPRLTDAMAALIGRRGHLRFADVRDLINREALSLPDLDLRQLWRGDRLGRFDRAAARSLPGVYQRGEIYVKGLQQLSAPLFGTGIGRRALRLVLLPVLAAWAVLEILALVWGHFAPAGAFRDLGHAAPVLLLGAALSATANTAQGRRAAHRLWQALARSARFLFVVAPRWFLEWQPVVWLLEQSLVRGLTNRFLIPVGLGLIALSPVAAVWLVAIPEGPSAAAWTATMALALAFGTLLRETPEGRRRLDDLATSWHRLRDLLRHERFLTLIAPIVAFFQEVMRVFAEVLHRIRSRLAPRLDEPLYTTLLKGLAAPLWAACEAVIRFYAVVLAEPQFNPVKHFPVVTLGHKLMLPFLPVMTNALHAVLSPLLPDVFLLPLVAVTIALLPGLFGFLFWELKENWGLYASNRTHAVPPARLGAHGETFAGMLRRGFHSGSVPKAFDKLRAVLDQQVREEAPEARRLRRALAPLMRIDAAVAEFAEKELGDRLRRACPGWRFSMPRPRIASQGIELATRLRADVAAPFEMEVELDIELAIEGTTFLCTQRLAGPSDRWSDDCRRQVTDAVQWLLQRCGAEATSSGAAGLSTAGTDPRRPNP